MLIVVMVCVYIFFFFFKQKTAYEMRISDWSSDVCSSDLQLVSGQVKARRVAAWAEFARAHPDGYLYCFRGGLRSQISQAWLKDEAGIEYPRVIGGYKAMRGFLLQTIEDAIAQCGFVEVGGMTGTGKTDLLRQLGNSLDLAHHAHHRGSSIGKHVTGQPRSEEHTSELQPLMRS